jgi:hypothetical protein
MGLLAMALSCSSAAPSTGVEDDGGSDTDAIAGTVAGRNFETVASVWWIGHPGNGSAPTQVYLSDVDLPCATLAAPGWDKTIGDGQLLEIGIGGSTPRTYVIRTDADANYLAGAYNPSSDGGSVTVVMLDPQRTIRGSFDLHFGADQLMGHFDAPYCAEGVEP